MEALTKQGSSLPSFIWKETVGATCQETMALVMTRLIFALTVEDPVAGYQWNSNPWYRTCVVMKQLTVEDLQYFVRDTEILQTSQNYMFYLISQHKSVHGGIRVRDDILSIPFTSS